jgi:hypothetical protein
MWTRLLDGLRECARASRGRDETLWTTVTDKLRDLGPARGVGPLLSLLAGAHYIPVELHDQLYELLCSSWTHEFVEYSVIERHCVAAGKNAQTAQGVLAAELWLQRTRRFGKNPGADYKALQDLLAKDRERTGRTQQLPNDCDKPSILKVGADEEGHLKMARLRAFAERVSRLFPFICALQRVKKTKGTSVPRPTLLRASQVARHVPQGHADPGNIIPLVLDGSFTAEGLSIRFNILLEEGTTGPQREAALDLLRRDTDLFDFQG